MNAVLDTNILVRAFLSSSGIAAQVLDRYYDAAFELVLSPQLVEELRRVLAYPHITSRSGFDAQLSAEFVRHLLASAQLVSGAYIVEGVPGDETDNALLAAAVEARADFLVTQDAAHLLPLKQYRLIDYILPIVSCEQFLRHLDEENSAL